ncbi:hypothetical protein [Chryseobacterium sp. G0240]|uniref:hypothetical protein n=1 Tax=Chryseobacterium sp. G0240 TaxID=2487066 RepID=UPI0011CE1E50|nr:hypothetical protein [Chryseobacterium sp. G0240]
MNDPYSDVQKEVRRYPFWDYEPVHHMADFVIITLLHDSENEWIRNVREGDAVFFRRSSEIVIINYTGDHYFLIGNVKALPYLYEINRVLPVSKRIMSLVYAEKQENIFPDLDHRFPLQSFIENPLQAERIIESVITTFSDKTRYTIIYLFCDSEINALLADYFNNPAFHIQLVYLKNL